MPRPPPPHDPAWIRLVVHGGRKRVFYAQTAQKKVKAADNIEYATAHIPSGPPPTEEEFDQWVEDWVAQHPAKPKATSSRAPLGVLAQTALAAIVSPAKTLKARFLSGRSSGSSTSPGTDESVDGTPSLGSMRKLMLTVHRSVHKLQRSMHRQDEEASARGRQVGAQIAQVTELVAQEGKQVGAQIAQ